MLFVLPAHSSTHLKVSVLNRVIAKLIDIFVVFVVAALLPYPFGPLLGFLYSLLGDGIHYKQFQGQSLGKRLLRLQVINTETGKPANLRDSALRNTPVGVATFFAIIPLWGWLILGLIGVPLMAMEIYLMLSAEKGHRLGDVMGDTEVIEAKLK
jgi:uncharacterized RDD family membrane protein YckC